MIRGHAHIFEYIGADKKVIVAGVRGRRLAPPGMPAAVARAGQAVPRLMAGCATAELAESGLQEEDVLAFFDRGLIRIRSNVDGGERDLGFRRKRCLRFRPSR